ncbi:MAG TPA: DUF2933 domain-containing protein [Candidatus Methanoperedens sp.]|nr:DUF2933 domain-containing protein [Candidatus Methanoperedens sp.]
MSSTTNLVFWRSRTGVALLGFLGIAAFFLFTEHRAHVLGALPYVLLLLCPLLHFLGHGGHGGHGKGAAKDDHLGHGGAGEGR